MTFHTNAMNISGQSVDKVHEKIYNPKSNHMIAINKSVYCKILLKSYMH